VRDPLDKEIAEVRELGWLDDAACADLAQDVFFVDAGHVIDDETLSVCHSCPVRRSCLIHSYVALGGQGCNSGYFGGMSPGFRKTNTLADALAELERQERDAAEGASV
jgi:hypothetical protein